MIETLSGIVKHHQATHLILENAGLGIGVNVPITTSQAFVQGDKAFLHTSLQLQMNARGGDVSMLLYGFKRIVEKQVFHLLIGISGIGPKAALRILSECSPEDLKGMVDSGNADTLTRLKGVGKKTAELLYPQLRDAFAGLDIEAADMGISTNSVSQDAIFALISLGVKEAIARKAVDKAEKMIGLQEDPAILIPEALRYT